MWPSQSAVGRCTAQLPGQGTTSAGSSSRCRLTMVVAPGWPCNIGRKSAGPWQAAQLAASTQGRQSPRRIALMTAQLSRPRRNCPAALASPKTAGKMGMKPLCSHTSHALASCCLSLCLEGVGWNPLCRYPTCGIPCQASGIRGQGWRNVLMPLRRHPHVLHHHYHQDGRPQAAKVLASHCQPAARLRRGVPACILWRQQELYALEVLV